MKNRTWKSALFKLTLVGAVAGHLSMAANASASASCAGAGYLCFYDYGSAQYGNLFGNNDDWRVFGWNDRADIFKNDGTTSNACVYSDIVRDFNANTVAWFIPRNGQWYDVPDNVVSANRWTTGTSCW